MSKVKFKVKNMSIVEKINNKENDIVFIYTISSNLDEVRTMGIRSINEKIAISVDFWPISSIYSWNSELQDISQYMVMFATQKKCSDKLIKYIEVNHSYNIPMIALYHTPIINTAYSLWVSNSLDKDLVYKNKKITKRSNKLK